MKKLVLFLILLSALSFAQSTTDISNSTTTTLDSAGVYTGGQSLIPRNYSSILIQVYSDKSSATNGVEIQFTNDKVNYDKRVFWSYTAGDTTSNFTCPVMGLYYRVKYTNGVDSQTVFRLTTIWSPDWIPRTNSSGSVLTEITNNVTLAMSQALIDSLQKVSINIITYADSLIGADTVRYNAQSRGIFTGFELRNGGADVDTATVQYKDAWGNWTTSMVGLIDELNNDMVSDNSTIIISNAVTKSYRFNTPYAGEFRIMPKVITGQAADKFYVKIKISN